MVKIAAIGVPNICPYDCVCLCDTGTIGWYHRFMAVTPLPLPVYIYVYIVYTYTGKGIRVTDTFASISICIYSIYIHWQRYRCDGRKHMVLYYCLRVTDTNAVVCSNIRYPYSGDLHHSSTNCTSSYCLHPYHGDNCMYIHLGRFVPP